MLLEGQPRVLIDTQHDPFLLGLCSSQFKIRGCLYILDLKCFTQAETTNNLNHFVTAYP